MCYALNILASPGNFLSNLSCYKEIILLITLIAFNNPVILKGFFCSLILIFPKLNTGAAVSVNLLRSSLISMEEYQELPLELTF